MPGIHHYSVFLATAVLLNLTPGPDTLYILGRSLSQGRRSGIASALGISTGGLGHTLAAALGLSAVLMTSAVTFTLVKYVGAIYLGGLGLKMILARPSDASPSPAMERLGDWAIYRQGVITNLLNPKVALFFLALLPQFVQKNAPHPTLSFLILGVTFLATGTVWCLLLAWFGAALSGRFRGPGKWGDRLHRVTGGIFIVLGARLAISGRN